MASEPLYTLITAHLERYPAMSVPDVYKLLHQSVFGQGHPVPNRKAAREWLDQEAGLTAPDSTIPLLESVHPAGEIVRVHVRPYQAFGGKLPALLDVYIRSGEMLHGDLARIAALWDDFCKMIEPGSVLAGRFALRDAMLLRKIRQVDHWAAVHHTPEYIQRYKPVYRVVAVELAEALCRDQRLPFRII
jgi:hypothetical protein